MPLLFISRLNQIIERMFNSKDLKLYVFFLLEFQAPTEIDGRPLGARSFETTAEIKPIKVTPPRARLSSLPALREVAQLQVVHGQVAVLREAGVVPAGLSRVEVVEVDLTLSCGSHLKLVRQVWRLVEDSPGQEPGLVSWRNWVPSISP